MRYATTLLLLRKYKALELRLHIPYGTAEFFLSRGPEETWQLSGIATSDSLFEIYSCCKAAYCSYLFFFFLQLTFNCVKMQKIKSLMSRQVSHNNVIVLCVYFFLSHRREKSGSPVSKVAIQWSCVLAVNPNMSEWQSVFIVLGRVFYCKRNK